MADKSEPDWEVTQDLRRYAWDWFSYHAGQRLAMFRFFLIVLGLSTVGYFTCLKEQNGLFAAVIAGVGMIASGVFYFLEMRNEHLVIIGRQALSVIEESAQFSMFDSSVKLVHSDANRRLISTHKFWIRVFYIVCFLVVLAAACRAFCEASPKSDANLRRDVQSDAETSSLSLESQRDQSYRWGKQAG